MPRQPEVLRPFREAAPARRGEVARLNLGPKSSRWLEEAGLRTVEAVRALGPVGVCRRLRAAGRPVSVLLAYAIEGGLAGCPWNAIPVETKQSLRAEFARMKREQPAARRATRETAARGAAFLIKTEVRDPGAATFVFRAQKTMYGAKKIAAGDTIYVFASENEGGAGLIARGIVTAAEPTPRRAGVERQTPRVSVTVERTARARRRLGRRELKPWTQWDDGRPETELNFKFYRQATDKIGGLSAGAAAWLERFF